jgi:hypothetical protein
MAMNRPYTGGPRPIAPAYGNIKTLMEIYQVYKGTQSKGVDVEVSGQGQAGLQASGAAGLDIPSKEVTPGLTPQTKGAGYYAKEMGEELMPGVVGGVGYDPQLHDPAPAHKIAGMIGNYYSYGLAGRSFPYKTFGVNR